MALERWPTLFDPFRGGPDPFGRLQRDMNRLFEEFFGRGGPARRRGVFPALNVSEDGDNLYVRAELPGVRIEDLDISVEGDTLTLRGERKTAEGGESVNYHRREREAGRFGRVVTLPVPIKADAVSASFKNGVLTVTLPKAEEVRPRQIAVKSE